MSVVAALGCGSWTDVSMRRTAVQGLEGRWAAARPEAGVSERKGLGAVRTCYLAAEQPVGIPIALIAVMPKALLRRRSA